MVVVAVVPTMEAETTRRAMDREGLLCTKLRAFRTTDGDIALPVAPNACPPDADQLQWSGGTLLIRHMDTPQSERGPNAKMRRACAKALDSAAVPKAETDILMEALPHRWEKLGDVVLFAPTGVFDTDESSAAANALSSLHASQREALWSALASALGACKVGVQGRIDETLQRKSTARLLWPPDHAGDGWTLQRDNGIIYGLDVTRSMFSSGNGTEKARVARFRCVGETVVDLYAGIGYFTLAYLVHAGATHLHACEWDPDALAALRYNLQANSVAERCTVHAGDNAASLSAFAASAHRVNLGLIPSSEAGWPVAVAALRPEGGMLHVHANVGSAGSEETEWVTKLIARVRELGLALGRNWMVELEHLERVKWYAPKVRHVVADVRCTACGSPNAAERTSHSALHELATSLSADHRALLRRYLTNARDSSSRRSISAANRHLQSLVGVPAALQLLTAAGFHEVTERDETRYVAPSTAEGDARLRVTLAALEQSMPSILDLPDEALLRIYGHLRAADLSALQRASSQASVPASLGHVWLRFCPESLRREAQTWAARAGRTGHSLWPTTKPIPSRWMVTGTALSADSDVYTRVASRINWQLVYRVAEIWERLRARSGRAVLLSLRNGCSIADFGRMHAGVLERLPPALLASLLVHDGQTGGAEHTVDAGLLFDGARLLSLDEIAQEATRSVDLLPITTVVGFQYLAVGADGAITLQAGFNGHNKARDWATFLERLLSDTV